MNYRSFFPELFALSTAVGLVATLAAPWLELRGTYAAWRIVEWHTFWRGEGSFQLASVVAANYRVPVEFVTAEMQSMLRDLFALGSALGAWHAIAFVALLIAGAQTRLRGSATRGRVAIEIAAIVCVNAAVLCLLMLLLALPASLAPKVDFRSAADIHSDSLIWSDVTLLPIAPALSILSALVHVIVLAVRVRGR